MSFNKNTKIKNEFIDFKTINYPPNYLMNYIIPIEYQNRPDLIAYLFYRDTSYQTLISFINRIDNSPEGYYTGRMIKILNPQRITSV